MHKHRADFRKSRVVGWTRCVADGPCNGQAHGGVTHIDVCSCGATRQTESNGGAVKFGRWTEGK